MSGFSFLFLTNVRFPTYTVYLTIVVGRILTPNGQLLECNNLNSSWIWVVNKKKKKNTFLEQRSLN